VPAGPQKPTGPEDFSGGLPERAGHPLVLFSVDSPVGPSISPRRAGIRAHG
jgi:hypothetical protein